MSKISKIKYLLLFILIVVPTSLVLAASSGSWNVVGNAGFTAGDSSPMSIDTDSNGTPYVAIEDSANSDKATVYKYNGSSWEMVGSAGFSTNAVLYEIIIDLDNNDIPYVAFSDDAFSGNVMKFNGTSWEMVGTVISNAVDISIAFDSSNVPYVAFYDAFANVTVMKYSGAAWVTVGSASFAAGTISLPRIGLDSTDKPIVVFRDDTQTGPKLTAMKFNGTSWELVGSAGFSAGKALWHHLVLDSTDTPYVSYYDSANADKTTVMKFNGTSWENVGVAGFTPGTGSTPQMALDSNDVPYVAFRDDYNTSYEVTVMKYNGSSWEAVGSTGVYGGWTRLAIDNNDNPYVLYKDWSQSNKATVISYSDTGASTTTTTASTTTSNTDETREFYQLGQEGGVFGYGGRVIVSVPELVFGPGFDYKSCSGIIYLDEFASTNIPNGFENGEKVYDIEITCGDVNITELAVPITICIKPDAGGPGNKQVWHKHGNTNSFEAITKAKGKSGWVCGTTNQLSLFTLGDVALPETGFTQGVVSSIPSAPVNVLNYAGGIVLEVPQLSVNTEIAGVPQAPGGWDVSWLGDSVGYLYGTAFPTWTGNTVLTGHVWDADNTPGIFYGLDELQHGDQFYIHAWGLTYTYEVRNNYFTYDNNLSPLESSDYDLVTLLTCESFSEWSGEYRYRRVIQAVLISVD